MYAAPFALLATLVGSSYAQLSADFVASLRNAGTAPERLALLKDEDLLFDFNNASSGVVMGAGGHTVESSSLNFPAVVGNGVSMTIGFLGPCAINTPHTHPRATEINFSVNGTLRAGLLTENGARFILNDLKPGTASVFPMGAIHFEMNTGCEPALFVAAFNSEDPGVLSVAQRYFGIPPDIIGAALGGLGVEEVLGLGSKIPDNVAAGTDECLQRCGLTRPSTQPTAQHQPLVSGNSPTATSVFFSTSTTSSTSSSATSTGTGKAALAATTSTASAAAQSPGGKAISGSEQLSANSASGNSNNSNTSPILIALVVINALLVVGLLVALFLYIQNRSRQAAFGSHRYAAPSTPSDPLIKAEEKYELGRESTYYDPYTPTQPEFGKSS
jgi:hypothetical protein